MKTKNTLCKFLFSLFTLLMVCGIGTLHTEQAEAAGKVKISNSCARAYAKKLNSLAKKAPDSEGYCYTIIRDMNNDGVPELLYNYKYRGSCPEPWTVYTYKKGKVKKLGNISGTLYTVSGKKTKYKYEAWGGVGNCRYGYITFGKTKIRSTVEAEYGGMPMKYYLKGGYKKGKSVSKAKYNRFIKKFYKTMTEKRWIKATDTYRIKWDAQKVKAVVS